MADKGNVIGKPVKPYPDFPLFPHATKRWAKKIRGRLYYFGSWSDGWRRALEQYEQQKHALHSGRTTRVVEGDLTVRDLVNRFLTSKTRQLEAGDLTQKAFHDYHLTCGRIIKAFGRDRMVDDLRPDDFANLRASMAATLGPLTLKNHINRTKVMLRWAYENHLIDRPVRYGTEFEPPKARSIRNAKAAKPERMFTAAEINSLLAKASANANDQMYAMILLGINCALGNHDIAELPIAAVELDGGWLTFSRGKTGIPRRSKLWPETVAAVKQVLTTRPNPAGPDERGLLFLTKTGKSYFHASKTGGNNYIAPIFDHMLRELNLKQEGVSFYSLRHSFRTAADAACDARAADVCMGHSNPTIAAHYLHGIEDDRLARVAQTVHDWLFRAPQQEPADAVDANTEVAVRGQ